MTLRGAIARPAVFALPQLVEHHDDQGDEQDDEDDAECIDHHSSPISHSASQTKPIHEVTPAAISHTETDCRATTWLRTRATTTRLASARSMSPSAISCRGFNRTIVTGVGIANDMPS